MENLCVEPLVPDFRDGMFEVRLAHDYVISQLNVCQSFTKWVKLNSDRLEPDAQAALRGFHLARQEYLGMVSDKHSSFPAGQFRNYVANLSARMRRTYDGDIQGNDGIAEHCAQAANHQIKHLSREVPVSEAIQALVQLGLEPLSRLIDLAYESQLQVMASLAWKHCLAAPAFIVDAKVGRITAEEFTPAAGRWLAAPGNDVLQHLPEVTLDVGRSLLHNLVELGRDPQGGIARPFADYPAGTPAAIPLARVVAVCPNLVVEPAFPQDLLPLVKERIALMPLAHRSEFIRTGVPYVIEMHGEYDFAEGERDLYRFATETETTNYIFTSEAMAEEAGNRSRHGMRIR
ncbi:hypothetical protein L4Z64_001439 [Pseudomonas aeruginosa]|nr:hypothetical protein [Pseudomonas aeruginosa]